MRALKVVTFLIVSMLVASASFGQCPANEADLADGGTFSGTCNITIGGSIDITGNVTWTSGTLSLIGDNGDINLSATLTINGGTVQTINNNNGDVDVLSGGSIVVASGAFFIAYEEIQIQSGGSMTVSGTVRSQTSDIDIDNGATVTVNSTGTLYAGFAGGTDTDILVQGTLINSGTVFADDNVTFLGTANVTNSGTLQADNDMLLDGNVTNSGTLDTGGDMTIDGNVNNSGTIHSDQDIFAAGTLTNSGNLDADDDIDIDGTVTNSGTMDAGDEFQVDDGGSLTTSGDVSSGGDFIVDDGELTIENGGMLDSGGDLLVYDGGNFTLEAGASATVADDVFNNVEQDNNPIDTGGQGQGTFTIDGLLTVGDDLTLNNTNPDSGLLGTGTIVVNGTFADNESPGGPFDSCAGGGATCVSALPIELASFTAMQTGDAIELKWTTTSEINNDFFTIEKLTPEDTFEGVLSVDGKGTSEVVNSYEAIDFAPAEGNNYYRLKQTDFDGKFSYSEVVKAEFRSIGNNFKVYPNPARNEAITIELNNLSPAQLVSVELLNGLGTRAWQGELRADASGRIKATISTSLFAKGLYLINAEGFEGAKRKIIIE